MRVARCLVGMWIMLVPCVVSADYSSGQQAYDAGQVQEALRAWQESAQAGEAQSQYQLGKLYEEGVGTIQNFVLAHLFYNLAASQGHRDAREARQALAGTMSKEQLAEAQQLAAQWQAAPSTPEPVQEPGSVPSPAASSAINTPEMLFMAVEAGDGERVQAMLQSGVDVNSTNSYGWTPLMRASLQGNIAIVTGLIGAKADVNHQSHDGTTALLAATLPGHLKVVKALVEAGADVSKTNTAGVTARFIAEKKGHVEIAKLLAPPIPEGMVEISAGSFNMGLDPSTARAELERQGYKGENEEFINNASPIHVVALNEFFIDKYEVTASQFAEFLNATGQREYLNDERQNVIGSAGKYHARSGLSNHPANSVTWHEAKKFCEWKGKRLPTEAEWEKAARGGQSTMYLWGDRFDGKQANFCDRHCGRKWAHKDYDDGYATTAPVGSFPPNNYGLYDMAGNVHEWVSDWYAMDYYKNSPSQNPKGPSSGEDKVLHGGAWSSFPPALRSANRYFLTPASRKLYLGFRCAKTP